MAAVVFASRSDRIPTVPPKSPASREPHGEPKDESPFAEPAAPKPRGEPKNEAPFTKPVAPPVEHPDPRIGELHALRILLPSETIAAASEAGLPLALAAAMLIQESGGGANVFGHDPTIFSGAGEVTQAKYLAYRAERMKSGNRLMQGVGPTQLTYWSHQDAADDLGGCWMPVHNMRIGFHLLAENVRRDGLHAGVAAYNGSGSAAEHYADTVLARAEQFAKALAENLPPH
jgi:hypothetical protein